jgi:hypothetical protein
VIEVQKIPTLFQRDFDVKPAKLTTVVNPDCQWVIDGAGMPTEKYDGTCCMYKGGFLYKRYNRKAGRIPADGWIPAQDEPDEKGNWPGWILVDLKNSSDKWHLDALAHYVANDVAILDGTYELVGPKINGNPYSLEKHELWRHGADHLPSCPRDFANIRLWLEQVPIEGVVWHHDDGRMAKIKRRDFELPWPKKRGDSNV